MKHQAIFLPLPFLLALLLGYSGACPDTYFVVKKSSASVNVDGIFEATEWQDAEKLTRFTFPWQQRQAPPTEFYAQMDGERLYFIFLVKDTDLVVLDSISGEMEVTREDRVELFFAKDRSLSEYYCFEMDPLGRVLDNWGSLHQKIDETWNCPDFQLAGKLTGDGYVVEGSFSLKTLESLGLYREGQCLLVGVYRAEFSHTAMPAPKMEWISWVKPDSKTPNFHIPSSFGCFCEK